MQVDIDLRKFPIPQRMPHFSGETLAMKYTVMDELLERSRLDPGSELYYAYRELQNRVGDALLGHIWNNGGCATVQLDAASQPRHEMPATDLMLRATVVPVHDATAPIFVPHFEYFPADWVCVKCGCIINGYTNPRMCSQCGAPRNAQIAMEEARRR